MIIKSKKQYIQALADLEDLRTAWKKALAAQSYTLGGEQVNHANLAEMRSEIDNLEAAIDAYETSGTSKRKFKRVIPMD